jgi:hypothetical protein
LEGNKKEKHMKKVLLTLALFIVHFSLFIDLHAVKLCKKYDPCPAAIANWKSTGSGLTVSHTNGCFGGNSSASGSGNYCWCKISSSSINGTNCGSGPWVFANFYPYDSCSGECLNICSSCVSSGTTSSCSRSALSPSGGGVPSSSSVTCPISGGCDNPYYKTVGDSDSCGSGWEETTVPELTVSGMGSDDAGTFTYGVCTK